MIGSSVVRTELLLAIVVSLEADRNGAARAGVAGKIDKRL